MTKDLDFVRDLLLRADQEGFSSNDPRTVYHIDLMRQAGLVQAIITPKKWKDRFTLGIVKRLTPAGRDFLSASKNRTVWSRTKGNFIQPGLFFSLRLIADYLRRTEERVVVPMSEQE